MREILFRGKCTDTGRWYEGQYIHLHKTTYCFKEDYDRNPDNDIHQIVFEKMTDWGLPNRHLRADVLPKTVGQYTGLTDKNGKKIFEGDILKATLIIAGHENGCYAKGFVIYDGDGFKLRVTVSHNAKKHAEYTDKEQTAYYIVHNFAERKYLIEVIGNIHDNPELMKGGDE